MDNDNECPICLDYLNNDSNKILKCNHIFHKKCVDIWLKQKNICPLCRSPQDDFYYARNRKFPFFNYKITIQNNDLILNNCFKDMILNITQIKTIQFSGKYFDIKYILDNNNEDIIKEIKLKFITKELCNSLFTNLRNRLI